MHAYLNGQYELVTPLPAATPAPDFTLPQVVEATRAPAQGRRSQFRRRAVGRGQALVLIFYPMDWEPVSREQLTLYQGYTDTFTQLHARLLGISIDHIYSHEAFARDAQLRFPLLADFHPRGQVARQYGVWRETPGVSARALFVLDRQRIIRFSKTYPDQLNPGVDELYGVALYCCRKVTSAGSRSAPLCPVHMGDPRRLSNYNGMMRPGITHNLGSAGR